MELEIEQEGCGAKWSGMGFGVWGSERGLGFGVWGLERGLGFGVQNRDRGGEPETNDYQNMKRVGEQNRGWGHE